MKGEGKKRCSKINDGQRWFHVLLLTAVYINRRWCMCHYFTNDSKSDFFPDDCFTVWCDLDPTDEGLVFTAWWRRHWVRVWCDMYVCLSTIEVFTGQQTRVCRDKTFVLTKMILVAAPANDSFKSKFGEPYERRNGVHNYGLSERIDTILNWTELNCTQSTQRELISVRNM